MKIVFLGDSITDAGRDRRNYHNMGSGYPKFAVEHIQNAFPDVDFEFINMGISGNRTCQLFDRLYADGISFQPDIVSVLIGINDVWGRHKHLIETSNEQITANYRAIMENLRRRTNARIIVLSPFLLDAEDKEPWRGEVDHLVSIIHALADEYADVYVPLDELFAEALKTQPEPQYYSPDGVHPNDNGRAFIGEHYFKAIEPIIRDVI